MLISKFGSNNIKEKLEEYEELIGRKLPEQFRTFILKYNGGETPNTWYRANNISSDLKVLYGVGNVKYSFDSVKPIEINDMSYLAVGCDTFGNELVICLSNGSMSFLDHENGRITKVADDFKKFLEICESKGIKAGAVKSVEEREAALIKNGRGDIITDALRDMWRAEISKFVSMNLEEVLL